MGFLCRLVALLGSYHLAPSLGPLASAQDRLRRQISAGDTLRARYPDHAQLSSLKELDAWHATSPQGPQGHTNRGQSLGDSHSQSCDNCLEPAYGKAGPSWSSNTSAAWFEELTHWKRPWSWERLKAGEGDSRGQDGWMASPTQWTWVWVSSGRRWRTGKPGLLQSMGCCSPCSCRVRHDWATEQLSFSKSLDQFEFAVLTCCLWTSVHQREDRIPCSRCMQNG